MFLRLPYNSIPAQAKTGIFCTLIDYFYYIAKKRKPQLPGREKTENCRTSENTG